MSLKKDLEVERRIEPRSDIVGMTRMTNRRQRVAAPVVSRRWSWWSWWSLASSGSPPSTAGDPLTRLSLHHAVSANDDDDDDEKPNHSLSALHPQVLLGDSVGGLYVCDFGGDVVVQRVGQTSVASALAYLDSGVVFVGSGLGDSMLVRLQSGEDGLEVLDTMANLGPIVDFACGDQGLLVCGGGGVKQVRGRCPCRRRCPCCPCRPCCRRWGGPEDGAEDHCASSSVETG